MSHSKAAFFIYHLSKNLSYVLCRYKMLMVVISGWWNFNLHGFHFLPYTVNFFQLYSIKNLLILQKNFFVIL